MIKQVKADDLLKVLDAGLRDWPGIIVHHTGGRVGPEKKWFFRGIIGRLYGEAIDKYHREVKGWYRGMGYHLLINPGGEIQYGTRWQYQMNGAHCPGHNDWLGVSFVGNFDWWDPRGLQLQTWRNILAYFPGIAVLPHGVFKKTNCPGTGIDVNYWFRNIDPK